MDISETLKRTDYAYLMLGSNLVEESIIDLGARCSSVISAFALCAMGRRIDPSCGEPIELFLVPASAPRLV